MTLLPCAILAVAVSGLVEESIPLPLNLNLESTLLPSASDDRLVKLLLIGDSQMGQSSHRLAGQVQKWDVDVKGRLYSCEYQLGSGVIFTSVTGNAYNAFLSSVRIELGQDHGDGNVGSHFHHSRRFSVAGTITPDFSRLGLSGMLAGDPARPVDFNRRRIARVAVYDMEGGVSRLRLTEHRGGLSGLSSDYGSPSDDGPVLEGDGSIKVFEKEIRAAGTFGAPNSLPVGIEFRDSDGLDTDRTLNILGTLIYESPQAADFPDSGLVVSHISQAGWSAFDHLYTLRTDAIDASIDMVNGYDSVLIMLGHNREDDYNAVTNPLAYTNNILALINRISSRHLSLGFAAPDFVLVAPWPLGSTEQNARLATQTEDLHHLCLQHGFGFINLFDFFSRQPLDGLEVSPRGSFVYTMDAGLVHPGNAETASNLMKDIEWSFDPANWVRECPADLAEPFGTLNFFDVSAFLAAYNDQDPSADFAAPFGVFNFFDVSAFLASYDAGCP